MNRVDSNLKDILLFYRIPVAITAFADPIAGAVLCRSGVTDYIKLIICCLASFSLYIFGIVLNDIVDLEKDVKAGRNRGFGCGVFDWDIGVISLFLFLSLGLFFALMTSRGVLATAFIISMLIFSYNVYLKEVFFFGALNMAVIRAFNFMMGYTLVSGDNPGRIIDEKFAPIGLVFIIIYIFSITFYSWFEDYIEKKGWIRFSFLCVCLACLLVLFIPAGSGGRYGNFFSVLIILFIVVTLYYINYKNFSRGMKRLVMKGVHWMVFSIPLVYSAIVFKSTEAIHFGLVFILIFIFALLLSIMLKPKRGG